ncbi:hypothetical protein RHS01_09896 [Rhizoctonia solani]|uniref:Uncharacterized protein n=1 Tax=Rhizoctonia solani TaxID=456999 RepID=A0A8H7I658_9AGAM|nr:hypothetical protein RHS01_09896 [Rhizoctonia solani]
MHGLKTPTLFGLRTSSRPASPAPCSKTSPPHVAPIVPTGSITPLDLSTPGSPIEGNKDKEILPRRPLGKLHLPSAFRRASPSPAPIPTPQQLPQPPSAPSTSSTGSNYLDALALRISEAAGKAIAPDTPTQLGRSAPPRTPPSSIWPGQTAWSAHPPPCASPAPERALDQRVYAAGSSCCLAPTNVLVPSSPWVQLGASQAHALGLATLVAELLASLDALPGDCAKVGGEACLDCCPNRTSRTRRCPRTGPAWRGKKDNPLAGPVAVAIKVLNRVASVPGSVAGGAIAACEIAVVWRAMVALAHRKIDPNSTKPLSTKSSGPLKSSSPTNKPKSTLPRRLTPPSTPPPARFLLPTSRPPSPPTSISLSAQLANDAKIVLSLLDSMPRPAGDDAKEAVGEAFVAFTKFCEVLVLYSAPAFDKDMLVRLIDGETSVPPATTGSLKSSTPLLSSTSSATSTSSEEDELPPCWSSPPSCTARPLPPFLKSTRRPIASGVLSGFGRAEASEGVVCPRGPGEVGRAACGRCACSCLGQGVDEDPG